MLKVSKLLVADSTERAPAQFTATCDGDTNLAQVVNQAGQPVAKLHLFWSLSDLGNALYNFNREQGAALNNHQEVFYFVNGDTIQSEYGTVKKNGSEFQAQEKKADPLFS